MSYRERLYFFSLRAQNRFTPAWFLPLKIRLQNFLRFNRYLLVILSVPLALVLFFEIAIYFELRGATAETPATVLHYFRDSKSKSSAVVIFRYEIDGQVFVKETRKHGVVSGVDYKTGSAIKVCYNPDNAEQADAITSNEKCGYYLLKGLKSYFIGV